MSVVVTRTVTVNASFLQEIKDVNQELWQRLEEMRHRCQRPIAPANCRHLVDRLSQLRDQLALHFALEEAYGYFEDPVWTEPQISTAAQKLREEHRGLYEQLQALTERAAKVLYHEVPRARIPRICTDFERFCQHFEDHEERENELMLQALYEDVGVGD